MDMFELINQAKEDLRKNTGQNVTGGAIPPEMLLNTLKLDFPPDPRIVYLDKYKDMLLTEDYEHIRKMITTFDLNQEELEQELTKYGINTSN